MGRIEITCRGCDHEPEEESPFCPMCGASEPWEEEAVYDYENIDFPVIVRYYIEEDGWQMWYRFCEDIFGKRLKATYKDIPDAGNVPDGIHLGDMKFTSFDTYWIIDSTFEKYGPYLSEQDALDSERYERLSRD